MVGINNIWVSYSSVHNRWKERDKAQILVDETQGNKHITCQGIPDLWSVGIFIIQI